MGQRFEQTVLEGRHTSASSFLKALTCLFIKKTQKHNEVLPHTTPNSPFRRRSQESAGTGKEMKGMVIAADDMNFMKGFPHIKIGLPCYLAAPLLGIFFRRTEIMISDRQLYPHFQGSSVHANQIRRQSVCPWVGERWKKMYLCVRLNLIEAATCRGNAEGTPLSERHAVAQGKSCRFHLYEAPM